VVTDTDGRTNIKYMDANMTLSNDNVVILRFDEATKTYSVLTDTGGICTLNTTASSYSLITNGYIVIFWFLLNDTPPVQNNLFTVRAEDDNANVVYEYGFDTWDLLEDGAITVDSIDVYSSEPCYQNHNGTQAYHKNWIDVNVTVTNEYGTDFISDGYISITNDAVESSRIEFRVYDWYWRPGVWVGLSSAIILSPYLCADENTPFLSYGFIDSNTMWFIARFRLRHMMAGNTTLMVNIGNNEGNEGNSTIYFDLGECFENENINTISQELFNSTDYHEIVEIPITTDIEYPPPNVNADVQPSITTSLILIKGADVDEAQIIDEGIMIWVNGELVYNSFSIVIKPAYLSSIRLYDSADNLIENNDWLYVGELYKLQVDAYNPSYIGVNISDTRRFLLFEYYNSTNQLSVRVTDNTGYVVGLVAQYNVFNETTGLRQLEWRFILNNNIVDAINSYWGAIFNSTINAPLMPLEEDSESNWLLVNIYNLGGFVSYTFTGDGKRIDGGDVFDLEATTIGSTAYAEVIYYNLQHVHILPELYYEVTWDSETGRFEDFDGGYYEYGMAYELDGEWIEGWKVRLYPSTFAVGHQNLGVDYDYVGWAVDWYQYNQVTDTWDIKIQDTVFANCWGYDNENADPDHHNRTSTQLWIDLWFSNHESSTIVAGRTNAYYYGMYEQGTSFWFGYGAFRPVFGEVTASMFFSDLVNLDNTTDDSYGIGKVKFWAKIEKIVGNDRTWRMHNFEVKNYQLASGRMEGIDTPPFVETKVLDMPSVGFLTPLIKAISGIPKAIVGALVGVGLAALSLLDTMFVGLGLPPIFSIIINLLSQMMNILMLMIDVIPTLATYSLTILGGIFDILFLIMGRWMMLIPRFIASITNWITLFTQFFTGGLFDMNIWTTFMLEDFLYMGITILFPFWWIDHVLTSDSPIQTFIGDIKSFYGLLTGILNIFLWTYNIIASIISIILGLK